MGAWDTGNFDNDGARDHLDDLIERLSATVTEILDDEERAALDEEGEAVVLPTVDILALLCEHYHAYPPATEIVLEWRDRYLRIFDDEIDDLAPAGGFKGGFKEERRAVIAQTFERLLGYAQAREDEDA